MSTVSVKISGVERSPLLGSLSLVFSLSTRSTIEWQLIVTDGWVPNIGERVEVRVSDTLIYAGSLDSVQREPAAPNAVRITCSAVDLSTALDRRIAGEYTWKNVKAGQIVRDIVQNSLQEEGISTTFVVDGPVQESFGINYPTVNEALSQVANSVGYIYRITPDGELRFHEPDAFSAPFSIDPTEALVQSLSIRQTREQYANVVLVKVDQAILSGQVDTFTSSGRTGPVNDTNQTVDGTRKEWDCSYRINALPTIELNGTAQSVGEDGVDTGRTWYFTRGSQRITYDGPGNVTGTIKVTYDGITDRLVIANNFTAIDERAAAEGNSGHYEILKQLSDPVSLADAQAYADAVCANSSELSFVATFNTNTIINPLSGGLQTGQRIYIARDGLAADGWYLIRSLRISAIKHGSDVDLQFAVEAIKGPIVDDSVAFFRDLAGKNFGPGIGITRPPDTGSPKDPELPSNLVVSIGDDDPIRYPLWLDWSKSVVQGGTTAYECELRFYEDAGCTIPAAEAPDWGFRHYIAGYDTRHHDYDTAPRGAADRWAKARLRAINDGGTSVLATTWIVSNNAVKITKSAASTSLPPGQPAASDWSVSVPEYRVDQSGQRWARIVFTVPAPASGVSSYRAWVYQGNPASTNPSAYAGPEFAVGVVPPSGACVFGTWQIAPPGGAIWWATITANTEQWGILPDASAVAMAKQVTIIAATACLPPNSFTITFEEDNTGAAMMGQPAARPMFHLDLPADPNRNKIEVYSRWTNSSWGSPTDWVLTATPGANDQSAHVETFTSGWFAKPANPEYHENIVRITDFLGGVIEYPAPPALPVRTNTPTSSGLKLNLADPSSLGKGLGLVGGQLTPTTWDSGDNRLANASFLYGYNSWTMAFTGSGAATIDTAAGEHAPDPAARIGDGDIQGQMSQRFPCHPGEQVVFTVRRLAYATTTYLPFSGQPNPAVFISFFDGTGAYIPGAGALNNSVPATSAWESITISAIAPTNAVTCEVVPFVGRVTSGAVWIDWVSARVLPPDTPAVSGAFGSAFAATQYGYSEIGAQGWYIRVHGVCPNDPNIKGWRCQMQWIDDTSRWTPFGNLMPTNKTDMDGPVWPVGATSRSYIVQVYLVNRDNVEVLGYQSGVISVNPSATGQLALQRAAWGSYASTLQVLAGKLDIAQVPLNLATGYDPAQFQVVGGMYKVKAIAADLLIANTVAASLILTAPRITITGSGATQTGITYQIDATNGIFGVGAYGYFQFQADGSGSARLKIASSLLGLETEVLPGALSVHTSSGSANATLQANSGQAQLMLNYPSAGTLELFCGLFCGIQSSRANAYFRYNGSGSYADVMELRINGATVYKQSTGQRRLTSYGTQATGEPVTYSGFVELIELPDGSLGKIKLWR